MSSWRNFVFLEDGAPALAIWKHPKRVFGMIFQCLPLADLFRPRRALNNGSRAASGFTLECSLRFLFTVRNNGSARLSDASPLTGKLKRRHVCVCEEMRARLYTRRRWRLFSFCLFGWFACSEFHSPRGKATTAPDTSKGLSAVFQ